MQVDRRQALRREIQQKYQKVARWYDWGEILMELLGIRKLRRSLLRHASGKILEIAVGTGANLPFYPEDSQLTAIDLSPAMLEIARRRADRLGLRVHFLMMDAEHLAFPDHSFDTVVDSLSLCTVPDPVAALREMARLCRPGGRVLLLEHGRSDREWLGRWQDRHADGHLRRLCCRWNQHPLELIDAAALRVIRARRTFWGIFHVCEAAASEGNSPATG